MTRDEIIEMAKQAWISDKEAQLITEFDEAYLSCTYLTDLTAFAKLVAAKAFQEGYSIGESAGFKEGIKLERKTRGEA